MYEPSPVFGERVLLLPGGMEEPEETHEETANRELQEEVGLRAERLDYPGELRPCQSTCMSVASSALPHTSDALRIVSCFIASITQQAFVMTSVRWGIITHIVGMT